MDAKFPLHLADDARPLYSFLRYKGAKVKEAKQIAESFQCAFGTLAAQKLDDYLAFSWGFEHLYRLCRFADIAKCDADRLTHAHRLFTSIGINTYIARRAVTGKSVFAELPSDVLARSVEIMKRHEVTPYYFERFAFDEPEVFYLEPELLILRLRKPGGRWPSVVRGLHELIRHTPPPAVPAQEPELEPKSEPAQEPEPEPEQKPEPEPPPEPERPVETPPAPQPNAPERPAPPQDVQAAGEKNPPKTKTSAGEQEPPSKESSVHRAPMTQAEVNAGARRTVEQLDEVLKDPFAFHPDAALLAEHRIRLRWNERIGSKTFRAQHPWIANHITDVIDLFAFANTVLTGRDEAKLFKWHLLHNPELHPILQTPFSALRVRWAFIRRWLNTHAARHPYLLLRPFERPPFDSGDVNQDLAPEYRARINRLSMYPIKIWHKESVDILLAPTREEFERDLLEYVRENRL